MRRDRAIAELSALRDEAGTDAVLGGGRHFDAWRAKVRGVLVASVGANDDLVTKFDGIGYGLIAFTSATPDSAWDRARQSGVETACGIIDAALYQLELGSQDEPVDEDAFDPELWSFVSGLVESEDWAKVASQVAIFVENHVRTWADDPKDKNGESLVGKALYATVFADESDWRLGARAGEREGWRFLGMGFAQAVSNVDRHRIQERDDARRYAIGVLGLGSLLLTQMRHEHPDLVAEPPGPTEERQL